MEGKWVSVTLTVTADHLIIDRLLDTGMSLSSVSYPLLSKPGCNEYLQTCGHTWSWLNSVGHALKQIDRNMRKRTVKKRDAREMGENGW